MPVPKPISPESVTGALAKAERYRLLNEPGEAESICLDILALDPEHQQARISLILALTDQISQDSSACNNAITNVRHLESPYDRAYYEGIVWERRAKARFLGGGPGASDYVYEWLVRAMSLFEEAEQLRPAGNDDAVLRWNACVRFQQAHEEITPRGEQMEETILLE